MALGVSGTTKRIEDWQARGMLDARTARALLDDLEAARPARSFVVIAVWLGIICLAFGVMTFMAANWEVMPRWLRMAALLGGMLASYAGAGFFRYRGQASMAEAFVLLGCGIFGALVMFTGQMYHLPGPPAGGVLVWGIGTYIAALATGGRGVLALAVILAGLWTAMTMTTAGGPPFHLGFLLVWPVLAATAWVWRARGIAHLCALAAILWLVISVIGQLDSEENGTAGRIALFAALAGISLTVASARGARVLRGFERDTVFYLMIVVYLMMGILYLVAWNLGHDSVSRERLDHALAAFWIAVTAVLLVVLQHYEIPYAIEALTLGIAIWTIRLGGRQEWRWVTGLGIFAFAGTMLFLYVETAYGLLGTSLFYMIAGGLLLLGALIVPRLMPTRRDTP